MVRVTPKSAYEGRCESALAASARREPRARRKRARTFLGDGKVEAQVLDVARVILEADEAAIELRIEAGKVVEVRLPAEPLRASARAHKPRRPDLLLAERERERERRTLDKKKPANLTLTRMPWYRALPRMRPTKANQASWLGSRA